MEITIRAFRATDEPDTCRSYIEGHQKVLEAYGVTKVTSARYSWIDDPNTYVIIVESPDGSRTYGGGRIQVRSQALPMPLEGAIAVLDKRIYPYVDALGDHKVAEFCGLWNLKEIAGYGIGSIYLGLIGVAITTQIPGLDYLMALCSPATLRNCLKVGFEIIRELGNNGTLYYPKEDLVATPLIIKDIKGIPLASETERQAIWNLRNNPKQQTTESGPKGTMNINFDITLTHS